MRAAVDALQRAVTAAPDFAQARIDLARAWRQDGRVLVRYSGTESKVRVLVEGPEKKLIDNLAATIGGELKKAIGA